MCRVALEYRRCAPIVRRRPEQRGLQTRRAAASGSASTRWTCFDNARLFSLPNLELSIVRLAYFTDVKYSDLQNLHGRGTSPIGKREVRHPKVWAAANATAADR